MLLGSIALSTLAVGEGCPDHPKVIELYHQLIPVASQGKRNEAVSLVEASKNKGFLCDSVYARLLIDVDYLLAKYGSEPPKGGWNLYQDKYLSLLNSLEDRGEDAIIYLRLAEIAKDTGCFQEVFKWSQEGLQIDQISRFYGLLVIASYSLDMNGSTETYFDNAVGIDPATLKQIDVMTVMAKHYADIGKLDLSKRALLKLVEVNPAADGTEDFGEAVAYLQQKAREQGRLKTEK